MSTTRFTYGVNNSLPGTTLASMGQLDPTRYFTVFDDLVLDPTVWGVGVTAVAGAGGRATIATTVAAVTPQACFVLSATKELFAKVKVSLAAVAASSLTFGFADDLDTPTAGVYITLVNGATLTLKVDGAAVTTKSATVAVAAATDVTFGFSYIPGKGFRVYLNDVCVLSQTDITNLDTATNLLFGAYVSGTTANLDYLFAAQER